jgi:hypothetical protein
VIQVPLPGDGAVPVNSGGNVVLEPGQKATITIEPEQAPNRHKIPFVAVDWLRSTAYRVEVDGTVRYDESPVPPVDLDSPTVPFLPALSLNNELTLVIKDLRETGDPRLYRHRVIGWEV